MTKIDVKNLFACFPTWIEPCVSFNLKPGYFIQISNILFVSAKNDIGLN